LSSGTLFEPPGVYTQQLLRVSAMTYIGVPVICLRGRSAGSGVKFLAVSVIESIGPLLRTVGICDGVATRLAGLDRRPVAAQTNFAPAAARRDG